MIQETRISTKISFYSFGSFDEEIRRLQPNESNEPEDCHQ